MWSLETPGDLASFLCVGEHVAQIAEIVLREASTDSSTVRCVCHPRGAAFLVFVNDFTKKDMRLSFKLSNIASVHVLMHGVLFLSRKVEPI